MSLYSHSQPAYPSDSPKSASKGPRGLPENAGRELPYLRSDWVTRSFCRLAVAYARRRVLAIEGLRHLAPEHDPVVFVSNHNQRTEALLLPGLLVALRHGKRIHFMADWPMMMVPGVASIYRCGQVIPVFGKNAKPAFLNAFKRFYQQPGSAWQRAGERLTTGASVGVYPEATMNRHPDRLLRGRTSAARLAMEHGVPVVPIGVRFPSATDREISDWDDMSIHIGAPLSPPSGAVDRSGVQAFHARIMGQISTLSGKSWHPTGPRRKTRR